MARRYEFYVLVARTISHSFASLTREIFFLPLEHKIHLFSPPCNILYLFPTALRRVQITPKTGTNITRYLYSRGAVRQVFSQPASDEAHFFQYCFYCFNLKYKNVKNNYKTTYKTKQHKKLVQFYLNVPISLFTLPT